MFSFELINQYIILRVSHLPFLVLSHFLLFHLWNWITLMDNIRFLVLIEGSSIDRDGYLSVFQYLWQFIHTFGFISLCGGHCEDFLGLKFLISSICPILIDIFFILNLWFSFRVHSFWFWEGYYLMQNSSYCREFLCILVINWEDLNIYRFIRMGKLFWEVLGVSMTHFTWN